MEFPLLILDLDETLIWAREEAATTCDFKVFSYFVSKRPHLEEFLQRVQLWYRIAVWTSSGEEYAQQVVGHLRGRFGRHGAPVRSEPRSRERFTVHEVYSKIPKTARGTEFSRSNRT